MPPPYLAGRDDVLAEAEDWLLDDPPLHANWALTGLRGTGKTVLLGEIATRASPTRSSTTAERSWRGSTR
jgi:predicted AAA+ superfamily ATPase